MRILKAVGLKNNEHMVTFTNNCWSMTCRRPGADVEMLNAALKIAGLRAEVIQQDVMTRDSVDWVSNGTADLTVHSIIQRTDRMSKVDFTLPINYLVYGYLVKEVDDVQIEDFIVRSIELAMYPIILLAFALSALLMCLLSGNRTKPRFYDWCMHCIMVLLKQPSVKERFDQKTAIIVASWTWFCFFFIIFYESSMKSTMTLTAKKGYIFNNLNGVLDAVELHGWSILSDRSSYDPAVFCRNDVHDCTGRIDKLRPKFLPKESFNTSDVIEILAANPKAVFFSGIQTDILREDVVYYDRSRRVLFIRDVGLPTEMLAFAVNKKAGNVCRRLNDAIGSMQSSYGNFAGRYRTSLRAYQRSETQNYFYVLSILYIWPLFRIMFVLGLVSVLLLLWEIIFHKYQLSNPNRDSIFRCPGFRFRRTLTINQEK